MTPDIDVWTVHVGLSAEIQSRFQISPAKCGRFLGYFSINVGRGLLTARLNEFVKLTLRVFTSPLTLRALPLTSKIYKSFVGCKGLKPEKMTNRTKKNDHDISSYHKFLRLVPLGSVYVISMSGSNGTRLLICRENELLKHQLKKYVGAVQALRSDLHGKSSETTEGKQVSRHSNVLLKTMSSAVKFYF